MTGIQQLKLFCLHRLFPLHRQQQFSYGSRKHFGKQNGSRGFGGIGVAIRVCTILLKTATGGKVLLLITIEVLLIILAINLP